jgi:peptidyl-prolyl cis-trans isomerase SurA
MLTCLGAAALCGASLLPAAELLDQIVAIIDQQPILFSELQQKVQIEVQRAQMQIKTEEEYRRLQQEVLESMIGEELLLIKAQHDSLTVEKDKVDAALKEQLARIRELYGSDEKYRQELAREGFTEKEFREKMRADVEKQLLREKVMMGVAGQIKITSQEIEEFFQQNKDRLPAAPESVRIAHLLLGVEPDTLEISDRLQSIQAQLAKNADFATLATQYSEDPGSQKNGRDLGWFKRGDMVKEFDDAVFGMAAGQVSRPVRTTYGYHLIKLEEKKDDQVHARHILIAAKPSAAAIELIKTRLAAIQAEIKAGLSFADATKKYSMDVKTRDSSGDLGWRQIDKLPEEFIAPLKALEPGGVTDPILTPYGYHLVKLEERRAAGVVTLESSYELIRNYVRNQKVMVEVQKIVTALKKDVYVENRLESQN